MPNNYAESIGGHLATFGTREERDFVFTSIVNAQWLWFSNLEPLIGVIQDHSAPDFTEPAAGWRWIDETPWTWNPWKDVPAPTGTCETADECVLRFANPNCDASPSSWHDDSPLFLVCPGCDGELSTRFAIVEFEIDCDGNGLVDLGEKLADLTLYADQAWRSRWRWDRHRQRCRDSAWQMGHLSVLPRVLRPNPRMREEKNESRNMPLER